MVTDPHLSNLDHNKFNGPSGENAAILIFLSSRSPWTFVIQETLHILQTVAEQLWTCLLFFWDFWNYWVHAVTPSQVTTPLYSSLSSLFPLDFTPHSPDPGACVRVYWGCHSFTIIRIIFSPLSQVNCTNWLYEACINKIPKSNKYASIPWALKKYQHVLLKR